VADSDCTDTLIAHSLRGEGFDASEDGTGRGTPLVPIAYRTTRNDGVYEQGDKTAALNTNTDPNQHVIQQESMAVRRLLPIECARLQGFPDDYLEQVTHRGKCPPADGPMYKAFGNSMAVPVMNWIGRRIAAAEST
jgi:DNA (cytosine-5)-methyltransferase 1